MIRLCVLYAMVICCLCLTPTLSRYTSEASGASTVQVAKFDVVETLTVIPYEKETSMMVLDGDGEVVTDFVVDDVLIPGKCTTYLFFVENKSEVTIKFSMTGNTLFGELPLVVRGSSVVLSPNSSTTVCFNVEWESDQNSSDYCGKLDMIELVVTAEQVD